LFSEVSMDMDCGSLLPLSRSQPAGMGANEPPKS
jgi:hypothetical protein